MNFIHFDALQRLLLKALSRHCQISIGLMYEPKRPEIFAAVERSYGYLSGFAELPDWQPQQVGRRPALEHFVVALGAAGKLQADDSDGVLLLEAADKESELRTVVRSIKAQLQAGAAYNDFLVVVRDFNTYSGIRAICDEYGVPVTLPQAASLSAQRCANFYVCF